MTEKSATSHAILDTESRHEKAAKIISALSKYCELGASDVLDIGTGAGVIAADIAIQARSVTSVDVHDERKLKKGYDFVQVHDAALPFPDASFDAVVYNHVVEHVADQQKHIDEIARVLRPGGLMYLATPNKFGPADPHYKLPLVSWLPRGVASKYVSLVRKKDWDIYPVSPWRLQRLTTGKFTGQNITADVIKHPADYAMPPTKAIRLLGYLPTWLLRLLQPYVPTQIHIFKRT